MRSPISDLDRFNNLDVLNVVWETFADLSRHPKAMDSNHSFDLDGVDSVIDTAFKNCSEARLIPNDVTGSKCPPFRHIVIKVYYSALQMGLLVPGNATQTMEWNMQNGPFHFTADGVRYFSEGFISVDDPGNLGIVLRELQDRLPSVEDGQIELLLEAQRCVKSSCNRAAMVVIGVASEEACTSLLEAIPTNCQKPKKGSQFEQDWKSCCNSALSFTGRWKPAIRILEAIKKSVRGKAKGETWGQWWEMVPGSFFTIGEAVRIARNAAAHDTTRKFSKAEVALLLGAMPTQLAMIANLTEFLTNPPPNIGKIKI